MLKRITFLRDQIHNKEIYPFSIPAIQQLESLEIEKPVTFFVGENGSGKSTLLEAIADQCQFNTGGGGRNNTYDLYESSAALSPYIRLSWLPKVSNGFFLRAESFYQFATHLDEVDNTGFRYYGGEIVTRTITWRIVFITIFKSIW